MTSSNPEQLLRTPETMLAYLRGQASVEQIELIELLMEADPLYEAAMEQLTQALRQNPALSVETLKQSETAIPEWLDSAKTKFVAELGNSSPPQSAWRNIPNWQKGLGLLLVLGILSFFLFPREQAVQLPIDPLSTLVPDQDVMTAEGFSRLCYDTPGIGRNQSVSLETAFEGQYAMGNYQEAIRQFELLKGNAELSNECAALLRFYLAKSLMAERAYDRASETFRSVLAESEISPGIRNASRWYLANLSLYNKDYPTANNYLQDLIQADTAANEHLPALLNKNYLETAHQYWEALNR